jgi:hypothetical protein
MALQGITNIVQALGRIVGLLIPILVGVAVIVFFWGLVKYIRSSGEGHAEGRNIMIAGLISLFVMVSLWGVIAFAGDALGITAGNRAGLQPPSVNGLGGNSATGNY